MFEFSYPVAGWQNSGGIGTTTLNMLKIGTEGGYKMRYGSFGGASETTECSSSPCTVYQNDGGFLSSVTRSSLGNYTLNFAAGVWTSAPTCFFQTNYGSNRTTFIGTRSASSMAIGVQNASASADNTAAAVLCFGN